MNCSKWIDNEKILALFVKILDIEVDNKKIISKDLQRYFDCKNISIEKHKEIEEFLIKEISKKLKLNKIDLFHLLNVLNKIKLFNPTLNASKKQLNFILLFDVIIPFLVAKLDYKFLELFEKYITTDNPFEKFLEENLELKDKLKKEKGIDAAYKNLRNWLNGKDISKKSKKEIFEFIKNKEEFEIVVMVIKSINLLKSYFEKEVFETLVSHIKLLIEFDKAMKNASNSKAQYEFILNKLQLKDSWVLKEYYYRYVERNDFVFADFSLITQLHLENILSSIPKLYDYKNYTLLKEEQFFNFLDELFLVKYVKNNLEIPKDVFTNKLEKLFYSINLENDLIVLDEISKMKKEEFLREFPKLYEAIQDKDFPLTIFFKGMFELYKGNLNESLELFKKSLKGINCIGINIQNVIEYGLMVSAKLSSKKLVLNFKNNKSDFVKFYFNGYRLGILPYPKNFQAILNDYKLKFERYFGELKTLKGFNNENIYFSFQDNKKIKPDLKKPNKKIKVPYKNYKIPQLLHFAGEGTFDEVKKLVEVGADVNYVNEIDNYTALIAAVENPLDDERRKIASYLIDKMDIDVIEKILPKKRESALSYLIRWGEVELVKRLIDKGVRLDWDIRVGLGNSTYLNYILSIFMGISMGLNYGNNSIEKLKKIFDLILENTDKKTIQKHKEDVEFMKLLEKFYPEKLEDFK